MAPKAKRRPFISYTVLTRFYEVSYVRQRLPDGRDAEGVLCTVPRP